MRTTKRKMTRTGTPVKSKSKRNVKYYHTRLSQDKIHFIQNLGTDDVETISREFKKKYGAPLRESTVINNLKRKVVKVDNTRENQTKRVEIVAKYDGAEYKLRHFSNKLIIDMVLQNLNND